MAQLIVNWSILTFTLSLQWRNWGHKLFLFSMETLSCVTALWQPLRVLKCKCRPIPWIRLLHAVCTHLKTIASQCYQFTSCLHFDNMLSCFFFERERAQNRKKNPQRIHFISCLYPLCSNGIASWRMHFINLSGFNLSGVALFWVLGDWYSFHPWVNGVF